LQGGVDLKTLQGLLGHSDISMTSRSLGQMRGQQPQHFQVGAPVGL